MSETPKKQAEERQPTPEELMRQLKTLNDDLNRERQQLGEDRKELFEAQKTATDLEQKSEQQERVANTSHRCILVLQMQMDRFEAARQSVEKTQPAKARLNKALEGYPDDTYLQDYNRLYAQFSGLYSRNLENNLFPKDTYKLERIADAITGMSEVLKLSDKRIAVLEKSPSVLPKNDTDSALEKAARVMHLGAAAVDIQKFIIDPKNGNTPFNIWTRHMSKRAADSIAAFKNCAKIAENYQGDKKLQSIIAFCRMQAKDNYGKSVESGQFKRDATAMAEAENAIGWLEIGIGEFNAYMKERAGEPVLAARSAGSEKTSTAASIDVPAEPLPDVVVPRIKNAPENSLRPRSLPSTSRVPEEDGSVEKTKKNPVQAEKKEIAITITDAEIREFEPKSERARQIHQTYAEAYNSILKKYPNDTKLQDALISDWSLFIRSNNNREDTNISEVLQLAQNVLQPLYLDARYSPALPVQTIRSRIIEDSKQIDFPVLTPRQYEAALWLSMYGQEFLGDNGLTDDDLTKHHPLEGEFFDHLEALDDLAYTDALNAIRKKVPVSIYIVPKTGREVEMFNWMRDAQKSPVPKKGMSDAIDFIVEKRAHGSPNLGRVDKTTPTPPSLENPAPRSTAETVDTSPEWQKLLNWSRGIQKKIENSDAFQKAKNTPDGRDFVQKMNEYSNSFNAASLENRQNIANKWTYWIGIYAVRFGIDNTIKPESYRNAIQAFNRVEKIRESRAYAEAKTSSSPVVQRFEELVQRFKNEYENEMRPQGKYEEMNKMVESIKNELNMYEAIFRDSPEQVVTASREIAKNAPEWHARARNLFAYRKKVLEQPSLQPQIYKKFHSADKQMIEQYNIGLSGKKSEAGMMQMLHAWEQIIQDYEKSLNKEAAPARSIEKNGDVGLIEISDEATFKRYINSGKPVLVKFGAPWCQPCKEMQPAIDAVAKGSLVLSVNGDALKSLTTQYHVTAYPTTIFFSNGKVLERREGEMNIQQLEAMIRQTTRTAQVQKESQ